MVVWVRLIQPGPFNCLYWREELAYVLAQSRCSVLVTMTGFTGLDYLGMLDAIAPGWGHGPTEALPELRQVVLLSTDGRGRASVADVDERTALGAANQGAANGGRLRSGGLDRVRDDGYVQLTGWAKELYVQERWRVGDAQGDRGAAQPPPRGEPGVRDRGAGRSVGRGRLCVDRAGAGVSGQQILQLRRAKLTRFKVPKYVLFLTAEDLPTTPTGKVQSSPWSNGRVVHASRGSTLSGGCALVG
jgi:hypothetical protein